MSTSAEASGDHAIAAGGSIGQALTGDGSVAMYTERALALPPEAFALPDTAPDGLVGLPDKAGLFVGRERELALLDEAFAQTRGVVVQAVHGLGGIGKSTLAARWAASRTDLFNPVWWIHAETPADLDTGLADLAGALQPALRDVLSRDALRERALQWLAAHEDWLLILDNVSSPGDVKPLLARASGGRFLITTRRATGWHGIAESLSLDVLELAEAVELFGRISGRDQSEETSEERSEETSEEREEGDENGDRDGGGDTVELCRELGCLPLAVEQAAAYCAEAGIPPGRYRELLAAYPEEVFARSVEGTDGERTVARVWRVTLDRLADTPLTEEILQVIAWWAPQGIPRPYLEPLGNALEVTEAVRRLAAYSMISLHEDDTLSVHRLVQAVARSASPHLSYMAAGLLLESAFEIRDVGAELTWLAHLDALASLSDPETDGVVRMYAFSHAGVRYVHIDASRAVELCRRALAASERVHGPLGEWTLDCRSYLAQAYSVAGDEERALSLRERNLIDHRRAFGRRDPRTFDARSRLAESLAYTGRLEDAESLARKNARKAERALGAEAETTLDAWAVWAWAMHRLVSSDRRRDIAPLIEAVEELLARAVAVVGTDGSATRTLQTTLTWAKVRSGDIARATALYEETVEGDRRRRGDTDRYVLDTRLNWAVFLRDTANDPARAREEALGLLCDARRVLGDDAPYVKKIRHEFGRLLTDEPN